MTYTYTDAKALADRLATGCHFRVGGCLCPAPPYSYLGCEARHVQPQIGISSVTATLAFVESMIEQRETFQQLTPAEIRYLQQRLDVLAEKGVLPRGYQLSETTVADLSAALERLDG